MQRVSDCRAIRFSSRLSPLVLNEAAAYRKVTWRLLPFLMLCYVVAYLDRVNVGFARLQMLSDLGFSAVSSAATAGRSPP